MSSSRRHNTFRLTVQATLRTEYQVINVRFSSRTPDAWPREVLGTFGSQFEFADTK